MKYKALVTGKNNPIIDDFFIHMDESFEVISCSTRYGDIIRHIKYFAPDVLVYCLYNESQDSLRQMVNIKVTLQQSRTPLVVIGSNEDCVEFERTAVNVSDVIIEKPFTAHSIEERIVNYLDERQEYVEEYRARTNNEKETPLESGLKGMNAKKADIDSLKNAFLSLEAALKPKGKASAEEDASNQEMASEQEKASVQAAGSGRNKHILVVDDDPIMLKTVKEQLRDDYDVATAISGKIAMKFLERRQTDLILLDYEMPDESGPVVLEQLRSRESTKDIPVVFLTGVSDREKITEALALKPQGYLLKPIDHDKLMDIINSNIR